ncbi:MAG: amidase family protein [Pseudomonadota bacterium]
MAPQPLSPAPFRVEEASIADLHAAIRAGTTTCLDVVEQYIARVRAFNGPSVRLVTADGAPIPPAPGAERGEAAQRFPTETVKAADIMPDLERYRGPPIQYGEMAPTASDPDVMQQYGWIVGTPGAGQVNALSTLNLRGERSVTCRGDYDLHPSKGPLPPGAPPICEVFRQLPDAREQAAALDARYGRAPDLEAMPMYGVVFSFKDAFDTKDMRSTGGGDAAYDMDVPARDHLLVEQLRRKGAIIFAKAVMTEYNGRAGDPGGRHQAETFLPSVLGNQRSSWGGTAVNPYDTARAASLGSSSGSGVSVSTNMVMVSLGEETRASCRGPSNHNAVALILPHKAMLGFDGGAIGADIHVDRTGIHGRTLADCAKVLDALRNPDGTYYDPRDVFTTVPRPTILPSYAAHVGRRADLSGLRIGIVRESMIIPPGSLTERPIVEAADREIKAVLRDRLGAHLVESAHRHWTPDPKIEPMAVDFRAALARLIPVFMPDLLYRLGPDGEPLYPEFAAAIRPTEFLPGRVFGTGDMAPIDYMVALADGLIPPPEALDLMSIQPQQLAPAFRFHISQYLTRRARDWAEKGFNETLTDWAALNARSKYWGDDQKSAFANWEEVSDLRNPLDQRQGINERIMLRELLRRLDMMVLYENRLDALVRLHTPFAPALIGGAPQPRTMGARDSARDQNLLPESFDGPNAGLTEILVPAGFVTTVYDPVHALEADGTRWTARLSDVPTLLPEPGLPFSLVFRAEPGREDALLEIASAYEAASRRRIPPPRFGPL